MSASGAVLAAVVGFAACGGSEPDGAVVRVGQAEITEATVDHWTPVMASGLVAVSYLPKQQGQAPRQRALSFLISSEWLIGEAAEEGLKVSRREVEQRFKEKHDSFPGGEAEFHEFLRATGRTVADVKFGIEAELASSKIRQAVVSREPKITQAQIVGYYSQNKQRFLVPERRYFDIFSFRSIAAAMKVKREVESGRNFAEMAIHESLERPRSAADVPHGKEAIERAIFSAKLNTLSGPVELGVSFPFHSIFEVRRIVAASYKPLTQEQDSIRGQLAVAQRQQARTGFIREWKRKWIARTNCRTGDAVPGCKQYNGPIAAEARI